MQARRRDESDEEDREGDEIVDEPYEDRDERKHGGGEPGAADEIAARFEGHRSGGQGAGGPVPREDAGEGEHRIVLDSQWDDLREEGVTDDELGERERGGP